MKIFYILCFLITGLAYGQNNLVTAGDCDRYSAGGVNNLYCKNSLIGAASFNDLYRCWNGTGTYEEIQCFLRLPHRKTIVRNHHCRNFVAGGNRYYCERLLVGRANVNEIARCYFRPASTYEEMVCLQHLEYSLTAKERVARANNNEADKKRKKAGREQSDRSISIKKMSGSVSVGVGVKTSGKASAQ